MAGGANDKLLNRMVRVDSLLFRLENNTVRTVLRGLRKAQAVLRDELNALARKHSPNIHNWTLRQRIHAEVQLGGLVRDAWESQVPHVQGGLVDMGEGAYAGTTKAVAAAFPTDEELLRRVGVNFRALPKEQILGIIDTPTNGFGWRDRWAMAGERLVNAVRDSLTQSQIAGEGIRNAAKRLQRTYGGGLGTKRAELIVRTESIRTLQQSRREFYDRNRDVISGLTYTATLDERTCLVCISYDNQTWWDDRDRTPHIIDFPLIPQHPGCRCASIAVTRSANALGLSDDDIARFPLLADLDGEPAKGIGYEEWLQRQPPEFQREVLGPARYALWSNPRTHVPVSSMVAAHSAPGGEQGRVLTLPQLMQRLALDVR